MTEEIKKKDDFNRRQFFLKLGLGSLSIAAAGTAAFAYQYLEPNVLFESSPVVNAGKPDRYPLASVTITASPCHGGNLEQSGKKIEGPAPKPLPWKRIWLNDDGDLLVDRSTD